MANLCETKLLERLKKDFPELDFHIKRSQYTVGFDIMVTLDEMPGYMSINNCQTYDKIKEDLHLVFNERLAMRRSKNGSLV